MKDKITQVLLNRVVIAVMSAGGAALMAAWPVWHEAFCTVAG